MCTETLVLLEKSFLVKEDPDKNCDKLNFLNHSFSTKKFYFLSDILE